jgi:hypothetical protein
MKKIIIGLSGFLLVAFVAVMVVNAQQGTQEVKKVSTEAKMDCGKCPSASSCAKMADSKTGEVKTCDPAKCKEMGCDPAKCKEGKCDPSKCKAGCNAAKTEMKNCDPSKCSGMAKK